MANVYNLSFSMLAFRIVNTIWVIYYRSRNVDGHSSFKWDLSRHQTPDFLTVFYLSLQRPRLCLVARHRRLQCPIQDSLVELDVKQKLPQNHLPVFGIAELLLSLWTGYGKVFRMRSWYSWLWLAQIQASFVAGQAWPDWSSQNSTEEQKV